jgi:hypothetical protein
VILGKDELISALRNEVRILLHLASKVDPAKLDYRPTPKQRSTLELLQYLTIMGPIHLRAIKAPAFDLDAWRNAWSAGEATAKTLDLEQAKAEIARHSTLFSDLLGPCSDEQLREEIQMFGHKSSRAAWIISLVLQHYAAYRMQLFLYLKSSGREELDTMNLWAGMDPMARPAA